MAVLAQGRVIASGSVDEMRALVSRRHIRCESRLAPELLRRHWPDVVEVSTRPVYAPQLNIIASNAEGVVRELLTADPSSRSWRLPSNRCLKANAGFNA